MIITPGTISKGIVRAGQIVQGNIGTGIGENIQSGYVQFLEGGTDDGLNLIDRIDTLVNPVVVNRPVLTLDAVGDLIRTERFIDTTQPFTVSIVFSSGVTGQTAYVLHSGISGGANQSYIKILFVSGLMQTAVNGSGNNVSGLANEYLDGQPHLVTLDSNGTTYDVIVDGTLATTGLSVGSDTSGGSNNTIIAGARRNGIDTSYTAYFNGQVCCLDLNGEAFPLEEVNGGSIYSDLGNEGSIVSAVAGVATVREGRSVAESYNIQYGYSLYEHATSDPIYVPYGTDGNPLTIIPPTGYTKTSDNPGGFVHNGTEVDVKEIDAYFTNGVVNFYSADGINADDKTFAQFLDHYNSRNGFYNLWIKLSSDGFVERAVQFPFDFAWTPSQYLRSVALFGGTPVVPFEVVSGGIGPDGTWFTGDGVHILLVEDI